MRSVQDFSPSGLKRARTRANMTQADVARAVGTTPNTVRRWERGLGSPSPRLFAELVRQLGVHRSRLLEPLAGDADLAALRTRAGLRQEDVAEHLDVQPSDISEMELGTAPLRPTWGGPLHKLYDVSLEELAAAQETTEHQWRSRFSSKRGDRQD